MLSVPFNGPVLFAWLAISEHSMPINMIFIFFQALGLLVLGMLVKREAYWRSLITYGGCFSVALSVLVFFMPLKLWPYFYGLMGISAAMFILGWSYPYTKGISTKYRMKYMALSIILSNIIYYLMSILLIVLSVKIVYLLALVSLAIALKVSILLAKKEVVDTKRENLPDIEISSVIIVILCLFIFGLYINGGFMYQVMYPTLIKYDHISVFMRPLPYIIVLLIMWRFGDRVQRQLPVYMGVSFMGLAFVAFSLLYNTLPGFFIVEILTGSSFAFLDLFFFTILGDISVINRAPYRTFGFGTAATVSALFVGGLLGEKLMIIGETFHLLTAMFALSAILLTLLVIPWIFNRIEILYSSFNDFANPETTLDLLKNNFDITVLTAREMETIEHLLQGRTNKEMAEILYVSENTIKTHIKNIYFKLHINSRKELMFKVFGTQKKKITHKGD